MLCNAPKHEIELCVVVYHHDVKIEQKKESFSRNYQTFSLILFNIKKHDWDTDLTICVDIVVNNEMSIN